MKLLERLKGVFLGVFLAIRDRFWIYRYKKYIRWVEKILELPEHKFGPITPDDSPSVIILRWEGRVEQVWYLLPSNVPKILHPLRSAIHEVRHVIQAKRGVPLLTEKDLQRFPELSRALEKIKETEEKDAIACAIIGAALLRRGYVEKFKQLMLESRVPVPSK